MSILTLFPEAKSQGGVLVLGELLLEFIPSKSDMRLSEPGPVIKTVSGSAGIYACAAAALGVPCSFIGKIGVDSFSQLARTQIEMSGVSTEHIVVDPEGKLGLAFVEYTDSGRNYAFYRTDSVGSRLRPEELHESAFEKAQLLHLPGMLLELSDTMRESCFQAVALAKKHHMLVSFDPNIRKEMASSPEARANLQKILSMSDMIEPTLEEGRILTGCSEVSDILRELHKAGPRLVVLTRDKDGAILSYNGMVLQADGINVPAVDPTGAGDTFAAALAYAVLNNLTPEDTLRFCNCAATMVCMKRGTVGFSIPTLNQALQFIQNVSCCVHAL